VGLNTQVLGISVDHVPCLQAWADHLGGINYPLLSDFWPHGEVSRCYDVFRSEGKSERAIFVIDTKGIIRYIDVHDIDQQPNNEELRAVIRRIDPEAAAHAGEEKATLDAPLPHGGIVMYCTPWCSDCKQARSWLMQRGYKFTEVDISRNRRAAAQVREWAGGHQTTPTFDIDGTIIVDFDAEKLEKALLIDKS
jgi:glutaredoxin